MEASGVVALMCALATAGASAGAIGSLAFEAAEPRMRDLRRCGDVAKQARERTYKLRKAVEHQVSRVPRVSKALNELRSARKRKQIRKSLPEVIRLLCISLDSGSSLSKALEYAADNSSGAMAKELRTAVWEIKAGQTFEEAMERLRQRTGGGEFACLSVAMEIQYRCGGTLSSILEETSSMLQQVADLEDELVTKTTQAQLSARVVALMPVAVLALLSIVSPGYLGQFVRSATGIAMLVLALMLEVIGVILVRGSLSIDIGMEER